MNGIHVFTLFRVPVFISGWFLLIVLYWGFMMGDLQMTIIWTVSVTVSILVHEFGHALVAKHYRLAPQVLLHGMGGLCSHKTASKDRHDALILIAGPGAGFVLAGLTYLVSWLIVQFAPELLTPNAMYAVSSLLWINLIWGFVNLIPLWPLDGGQLYRLGLAQKLSPAKAELITHRTGIMIGVIGGIYGFQSGDSFIGIFSLYFAYMNYKQLSRPAAPAAPARVKNTYALELLKQAQEAIEDEEWKEAGRLAHQIRDLSNLSDNVLEKAWFILALSNFHQERYKQALSYVKRAKVNTASTELMYRCFIEMGELDRASEFREERREFLS